MAKKTEENIITASNGRKYVERPDGRLQEISDPVGHAKRQLAELTSKHTVTGLRLVNTEAPDEPAVVVTLSAAEAKPIVAAIKAVLSSRAKAD